MDSGDGEEKDYAHKHDPQAQRSRIELWVIVGLVLFVLLGSLAWRAVTGRHAGPQAGWGPTNSSSRNINSTPAAAAGVPPHGIGNP
jgi:hypothetical protein